MESYTIVCENRTFGRQVRFSYESVKDTQKVADLLKATVGTWGQSTARTKDKWYVQLFNYGAYTAGHSVFNNTISGVIDDSSGNFIYDGKPFFASAPSLLQKGRLMQRRKCLTCSRKSALRGCFLKKPAATKPQNGKTGTPVLLLIEKTFDIRKLRNKVMWRHMPLSSAA